MLVHVGALMAVITFEGRPAAVVEPRRVQLAEHIAALEFDHPVRFFVGTLVLVCRELQDQGVPWNQEQGERIARAVLIDADVLRERWDEDDAVLAEAFNVPLAQLRLRRREVG